MAYLKCLDPIIKLKRLMKSLICDTSNLKCEILYFLVRRNLFFSFFRIVFQVRLCRSQSWI